MAEFKPCPFCGSDNLERIGFDVLFKQRPHIRCNCCGVDVYDAPNVMPAWHKHDSMVQAWNARPATAIGQVAVEVVPTKRTCKLEPLKAFEVTVNMLDQTEWGVCSNCGTASPIDATYCCECGAKVVDE